MGTPSANQPVEKERIALVIITVVAVLCLGFAVISSASKQKEVSKRIELETKLDRLARENGKLQKEINEGKVRLEEELHLNQVLNSSLGKEQENAQVLRAELEKIGHTRVDLEKQLQQLKSANQSLERQLQAKVVSGIGQQKETMQSTQ